MGIGAYLAILRGEDAMAPRRRCRPIACPIPSLRTRLRCAGVPERISMRVRELTAKES